MPYKTPNFTGFGAKTITVGTIESQDATSVQVNLGDDAGDDFVVDTDKLVVEGDNGRVGIGTASPDGRLHVMKGSAGSVTASGDGNALVVESDDVAGMTLLSPGDGVIYFGDAADSDEGRIVYKHSDNSMNLWTNNAVRLTIDSSGDATFAGDVTISGTTPLLTIGDAGTEDTMLVFDGNAADFRIGIDDGTDTLEIGKGSAHGTTTVIKIDSNTNLLTMGNSAPADGEYSGDIATITAGEALTVGEVCYLKSDGKLWKAVATAAATSRCVAMCVADVSADAAGIFLLRGFARFDAAFPTFTVGGPIYTPEAEAGGFNVPENDAPDTDGDFVQIIGWAMSADSVYFNPSSTVIEVA